MSQLKEISKPFPDKLIKEPPRGKYGSYVPHSIITERLLSVVGPFSFEVLEVIRGYAPAIPTSKKTFEARENAVVGVMARLTITIDGRKESVTEIGTEDNPAMGSDAENAKNAASDAIKRCAMRFGCGLHLWSQDDYFLHKHLEREEDNPKVEPPKEGGKRL